MACGKRTERRMGMIRYILIVPAVLMAACVALYVWAAYDTNPFEKWEEAYN